VRLEAQTAHRHPEHRPANLRAGNREAAGNYALRLQTVQRELAENRAQLEQAETTYKELIKARDVSVKAAQAKIEVACKKFKKQPKAAGAGAAPPAP
jgi:hypothetical protein